jgi:hypothetical protein
MLLALTKEVNVLPTPAQLRKGHTGPQKIETGLTLHAQANVSIDRRFVRIKLIEKHAELEGDDKTLVLLDNNGAEGAAEIPFVKESMHAMMRNLPDGATILLTLQYRRTGTDGKTQPVVVRIEARIYIEAEERLIREEVGRPGGKVP